LDKTISNHALNSKESHKKYINENQILPENLENTQIPNQKKLIGRKRNKESEIFDMSFIEKEAKNTGILLKIF